MPVSSTVVTSSCAAAATDDGFYRGGAPGSGSPRGLGPDRGPAAGSRGSWPARTPAAGTPAGNASRRARLARRGHLCLVWAVTLSSADAQAVPAPLDRAAPAGQRIVRSGVLVAERDRSA